MSTYKLIYSSNPAGIPAYLPDNTPIPDGSVISVPAGSTVKIRVDQQVVTRQIFHGALIESYDDAQPQAHVDHFTSLTGKRLYVYDSWIMDSAHPYPDGWLADPRSFFAKMLPLLQNGTLKALSLAWMPHLTLTDQSTLNDIWNTQSPNYNAYSDYIYAIADQCKAFGYPIYMRFGGEFNICQGAPGDGGRSWATNPIDFVNAWRRCHDIFKQWGAYNVIWVWNPNCLETSGATHHWNEYYPGDSYVDWVGIDLYQFADTLAWCRPEPLIKGVYDDYAFRKPIAICEWAVNSYVFQTPSPTYDTPDAVQAAWMTEFFNAVEARPQIRWISYYYSDAGHWKFDARPLTLGVYRTRIANPMYVGS